MGLCKCPKRKVTNLFCFECAVNVCEHCLVKDHADCIVQSYVQWLQDSDYQPICILCKEFLKNEPTVRLTCYDVFHWRCLDKYASQLPANTAPAGYQCPKCKECLFPPLNLVSPVADALRAQLETVSWAKTGLGRSMLKMAADDIETDTNTTKENDINHTSRPSNNNNNNTTDDESNGFIIIKDKANASNHNNLNSNSQKATSSASTNSSSSNINNEINSTSETSHIRGAFHNNNINNNNINNNNNKKNQFYDSSLGVVLNVDNLGSSDDKDSAENKYKRRPLFEWLSRWLKSRQLHNRRLFRMSRQKKMLFMILFVFISLFTLIVLFSRIGSLNTENDPSLDPMNNPNIHVDESKI